MSNNAADYLEQLRGRMSGVSAFNQPKRKKPVKSRQNITTTRFDERAWGREREGNAALDSDITDLYVGHGNRARDAEGNIPDVPEDYDYEGHDDREAYDNAPELVQDLWQSLYKPVPRFREKREVFKDAALNRRILEEVQSHPDYERLHDLTMTDQTMATMATHTFMNTLREIIRRNQEAVQESNGDKQTICEGGIPGKGKGQGQPGQGQGGQSPQPGEGDDEDENEQEEQEGEGEGQGDGDGDGEGDTDERPDSIENDEGGSGHDQYDEDEDDDLNQPDGPGMDDESDGKGEDHDEPDPDTIGDDDDLDLDDLDRAIHKAMEETANEFDELDGLRKGIGLEDGQWGQMTADRRLSILNTLRTPQMKVLADIVGRMKKFAMSMQAQKIIDAPEEAFDVETGNDLRHLLRSEFVYLGQEETKPIFYSKYMEKELLQYKLRGRENAGKGPIFVCIDKSYSMSGDPFNWAMAVAEALRRICSEQKRDYYATFFGTNNDRHRFDFPKGESDFDKILEFLQSAANGGTQFDGVLTEALERTEEYGKRGAEKADIVFITDGQAHLTDEWIADFNERRTEHGTRVFSVFIGGAHDYYGAAPVKLLEQFSDVVIPVKELSDRAVADIFKKV